MPQDTQKKPLSHATKRHQKMRAKIVNAKTIYNLVLVSLHFLLTPAIAQASSTVQLYSIEKAACLKETNTKRLYILHLGAFHHPENAARYKKEMARYTTAKISEKTANTHQIFIGPLDAKHIAQASRQLLAKKPASFFYKSRPTITKVSYVPRWFVTANLGPAWSQGGQTQTFALQEDVTKTYTANNAHNTLINAAIFLGAQQNINRVFFTQLGFAFAATDNVKFSGNIWEDADPDFANYNYDYNVVYSHIALKAKLFARWTETTQPYIGASAGMGFNRAHHFFISPRIPEAVPAPPFTAHTKNGALAYTLEVGLQHLIDAHWRGGVGYEFADWGASSLGRAVGQTLNSGITLSHLYTNGIQFNLTYVV